ncbi:peptidase, M23 family [Veillonellaceae bacterium DNF00626]|nr:peptidase, M23 family [Veillonellaceae bacterium DNF00626]
MKYNRYVSALLAVSLLLSPTYLSTADDLDNELQDVQGQIDESRSTQASWQAIITDITEKLKAIQAELDEATRKLQAIKKEQDQVNLQIKQLQEEIQKAEVQLRARQAILNKRVRVIYMHGQLSYIEVILGANSFSDFANRLELLKRIIRSDFNLIQEIQQRKAAIEAKKVEIEKEKARLDELASEAQKVQDEVKAKKAEQQRVLAHARTQQDAAKQMEADLIARSNEIRQMIQSRMQQNSGSDQIVHGNGTFIWPCNGPITSPFGYRTHPIFGTTIYHSGIDIGVDYNTPIHAADGGTVILAGWCGGYGNAVIIDHGNGLQTLYGHNTSVAVSEGQTVSQGQVIAYSGSTGYSTGPHCHFEVRRNGEAVDPMGYL